MITEEDIPNFERILGILLSLLALIALLFAMALLVEKYMLSKMLITQAYFNEFLTNISLMMK